MKKEDNLEVKCPECGHLVPVSEVLRHQVGEELKAEMGEKERSISLREKSLTDKAKEIEDREKGIQKQVEEKVSAVLSTREQALDKRESAVATAEEQTKKAITDGVQEGIKKEKTLIEARAAKQAQEAASLDVQDLKAQLTSEKAMREKAEKNELGMREREKAVEDAQKGLELEKARIISEERAKAREESRKTVEEEFKLREEDKDKERRFKDIENQKMIDNLKASLEEANRRAQQGSQQLQGEVQELDLEAFLREQFRFDEINPVAKGQRGADVMQIVKTASGAICGSILWESKRTKNWTEGWIAKFKDDRREAGADIGVIVTDVLPKDLPNSGQREGVWVTSYKSLPILALALRGSLVQVASAKLAAEHKGEIGDLLFRYVTSPEFKHRVEAMLDTYRSMSDSLEREKRSTTKRWGEQQKLIEKVTAITAGTYGDLQGYLGSAMEPIQALEAGDDETDSDTSETDTEKPVVSPMQTDAIEYPESDINPDDIPF